MLISINGVTCEGHNHAIALLRSSVGPTRFTLGRLQMPHARWVHSASSSQEPSPPASPSLDAQGPEKPDKAPGESAAATVAAARAEAETARTDAATAWAAAKVAEDRVDELERELVHWLLTDTTLATMPIEQLEQLEGDLVAKRARVKASIEEKLISKMAGECTICMENPKNVVFGCGHRTCEACATLLGICHAAARGR